MITADVEPAAFDEAAFFRATEANGARALLIGRRTLVVLGLPVLMADYDFWVAIDDIAPFNAACQRFDLMPTHSPGEARRAGRYALENDEHIGVLVARSLSTADGELVEFESLWARHRTIDLGTGASVRIPTIDDLILTKRIAPRPKDLEDIRLLEALRAEAPE